MVLPDHRVRRPAAGQPGRQVQDGLVGQHHDGAAELDRPERGRGAGLSDRRTGGPADDGPTDEWAAIRVFTTRADTVFGATFMVLAPEHPLVDAITTPEQRAAVEAYRRAAASKDLVSRKVGDREKTGVFTGGYAVNPATGKPIPVWIADYVLMEYGTGAIMAVPGHDERDFEFATKFELADRARGRRPERATADTPLDEAYTDNEARRAWSTPASSTACRSPRRSARSSRWLESKRRGQGAWCSYRLHDWCISRQRYWGPPIPIIYCDERGAVPVPEKDLPGRCCPLIEDFTPDDTGISPLARHEEWYHVALPGVRQARPARDRRDRHLPRLGVVLPALPEHRVRRPSVRPGAHPEVAARCTATSAATSTRCCTCCTRASSPWCCTTSATWTSRSRTGSSARTG